MKLPEIVKTADGKAEMSFDLGLDLDKDGKKSLYAKIVIGGEEKEITQELLGELLKKVQLPDWLKGLVQGAQK